MLRRSAAQEPLLLGPSVRQLDAAGEPRGGQVDRLLAVEDRLDNVRRQEGKGDQPPDIMNTDSHDPFALGGVQDDPIFAAIEEYQGIRREMAGLYEVWSAASPNLDETHPAFAP